MNHRVMYTICLVLLGCYATTVAISAYIQYVRRQSTASEYYCATELHVRQIINRKIRLECG